MLRREVRDKFTNVSEELSVCVIRILMTEAVGTSETSVNF
jgi:hypothetical protein